MKNLKDTVTTICGVIVAISGAIFTMTQSGVVLPSQLTTAATTAGAIAVAILAYFTGKNPDGSTKSAAQIEAQNSAK